MTTKYLLGAFLLVATLLAIGAVAASLLSSDPDNERHVSCPELVPASWRDADAQSLVDRVDAATIAAHGVNDDVQFHSITTYTPRPDIEPIPYFYFVAKNRPPVIVDFGPDSKPRAREADVKFSESPGEPLALDDLMLGPGRAASVVQAQYPTLNSPGVTLVREDCRLVWHVVGFIDPQTPLWLHAAVESSGELTLPEGPPKPVGRVPSSTR